MSLQLLIDATVNAGAIAAPPPIAAAPAAAPALDFGDRVAAAYEQNSPHAIGSGKAPTPRDPERFKPGANPDFGDAVAEAFQRNFPRAVAFHNAPTPEAAQEPHRFKPGASADFGDRVAAAYDRLFPPKGVTW